jgi:beta-N-acetylhexosaminidase
MRETLRSASSLDREHPIISCMDLEELAAGVLVVGFNGITFKSGGAVELESFRVGGVILRSQNVVSLRQTRDLTDAIRALYQGQPDPIIAIDQEGGRIARLHDGVVELPPMMALGAAADATLARRAGKESGNDLRRAGVNFTFGPVLDLAVFRENTGIGARSFGADPQSVARIAGAFAEGMREAGVVPAFKHFPGHGSTTTDSNVELPVVDANIETLRARDFVPFAQLLPGAKAVSCAHMVVKALDPDRSATTSPAILTDLLRKQMHFAGVCLTDCMEMDAIVKTIGGPQAAVAAIAAGADAILVSRTLAAAKAIARGIVGAVRSGALSQARLEEAYARVRALRESLASPIALDAPHPDAAVGDEASKRAITAVRGYRKLDPVQHIVISFEGTMFVPGAVGLISKYYSLAANHQMPELKLPFDPTGNLVDEAIGKVRESGRTPIVLTRRAHIHARQAAAVEQILKTFPETVLVSLQEPYDALMFPQAQSVLCTYGDERTCIEGLASVLFDGAAPRGMLPVKA